MADDEDDELQESNVPATPRLIGFVLRLVLRHRLLVAASVTLAVAGAAVELLSIGLLLPFLETLRGGGSTLSTQLPLAGLLPDISHLTAEARIRYVAVGLVVLQVARGGFAYLEGRVAAYQKILLERDLRQMVFDDLLRLEMRFLNKERVGNLYALVHGYPKTAAGLAAEYLGTMSKAITFFAYAWVMFQVSWQLTLIATALGLASVLGIRWIRVSLRRLGRKMNESRVKLNQVSLESIAAMKMIRLFGREDHARSRFMREVRDLQRQSYRSASLSALAGPLQRVMNVGFFAVLLVAATFVLTKSADDWLLLLTLFLLIVVRLIAPMTAMTRRQTKVAEDLPALEQIVMFLEREDKPYLVEGERAFAGLRERVVFDDVTFAYDDRPVLENVSFALLKGRTVALVGASGSGKTTIANLLARLSDPTSGRVVVDGVDLREYRSVTWRQRIAVVSQDTFLFNDTVRENIRFGRLDATDAEVEAAARKANAHEFIVALEEGYDTITGDRGVRLSGGQAQRIAIARALLADPEILILDEATSALDTETERLVQQALEEAARDRTVLAIAHRLSTVRRADEIVVLEKGRVVERGRHDDLLARRGRYWTYVTMQDLGVLTPAVE